jgi:nitroimidazol reductase NimA-like FMN-containing flavoprotein (pyridoxamine 5'-phosphate oxidase superfamily)
VTTQKKKAKKETTFRSRNAPFIILSRAHSSNGQILLRYRVVFVFGVARELEEHGEKKEKKRED